MKSFVGEVEKKLVKISGFIMIAVIVQRMEPKIIGIDVKNMLNFIKS
jgi:hypothetical protein